MSIRIGREQWRDRRLRGRDLATRGIWVDVLMALADGPRRGFLDRPDGGAMTVDDVAALVEAPVEEVARCMAELVVAGLLEYGPDDAFSSPAMIAASAAMPFEVPADEATGFGDFWAAYPSKINAVKAEGAWITAVVRADPAEIIAAAKTFAAHCRDADPRFIPQPARWLEDQRWRDVLPEKAKAEVPEWKKVMARLEGRSR